VWRGIKEHLATISSNSIWIVGTGVNINLWTDNWLGIRLVDLLHISPTLHTKLRASVADVIMDDTYYLPAASLAVPEVASHVAHMVLPTTPLPDALVWLHSPDGKLTSKLSFNFLQPAAVSLPWGAAIWKFCIPPSHSFILWRIMHGKMLTDENLRHRGYIIVSICSLCLGTNETSAHLFLHCSFATNLWLWLGGMLHITFNLASFETLFSSIPPNCSSQMRDIYLAALVHTLHDIWLTQNSLRFTNTTSAVHSTKARIHAAISFSGNISTGKCIASDANILDAFSVSSHNLRVSDILMVSWKAPTAPWIKVNTDDSLIGTHAACGRLFRDHLGSHLGAFACNIGHSTVFYVDVYAFLLALEFADQHGWRNVWLESDSTSALMVFKNRSLVPVLLRNRWHNACTKESRLLLLTSLGRVIVVWTS